MIERLASGIGIVLWWCVCVAPLSGQDSLSVRRIDTRDGLSQGMIYTLAQDQMGFVWMGNKNGLDRYDGRGVVSYYHDPFEPLSLPEGEVLSVVPDIDNGLWVVTSKALSYFDGTSGHFYEVLVPELTTSNFQDIIYDVRVDDAGRLLFTNNSALFELKRADIRARRWDAVKILQSYAAYSVNYATWVNDTLWAIVDYRALCYWDADVQQFIEHKRFAENIISIDETSNGWLWLSTMYSDYILDGDDLYPLALYEHTNLISGGYLQVREVESDEYLVHLIGSNRVYRLKGNRPDQLQAELYYKILPKQYVSSILRDEAGNTWIGTNGYGVDLLCERHLSFTNYLPSESISRLRVDKNGDLLARSYLDFYRINRTTNKVTNLSDQMKAKLLGNILHIEPKLNRSGYWVLYSRVEDWRKEPHLVWFDSQLNVKDTARLPTVFDLFTMDEWGRIWLAGADGKLISVDTTKMMTRLHPIANLRPLKNIYAPGRLLTYDAYNRCLWQSNSNGLLRVQFSPDGEISQTQRIISDPSNPQSLSSNSVLSVHNDPQSPQTYLWIGTSGGGLNRLHLPSGECRHFSQKTGLPDNVIYGILPGREKELWLSTNKGLVSFRTDDFSYQHFLAEDGLPNDEFNTWGHYKHPYTDELLFGGITGFTIFSPSAIDSFRYQPKTWITEIRINNQPLAEITDAEVALPEALDKLSLQWNQNHVTFRFAALDYASPERCQFRYRMIGIDKDWLLAGQRNYVNYSNLKPGRYRFEVQATNSSGIWSPYTDSIAIRIYPPWWLTPWAYLAYLIFLVWVGYTIIKYRFHRIELQNKVRLKAQEAAKLKELDQLKTDFFTNITHELKTPLQLIQEPLLQALNRPEKYWRENVELAAKNTQRLVRLTNQLLELARATDSTAKPRWEVVPIKTWCVALYEEFVPLAHQNEITYSLTIDTARQHYLSDTDKLEKIIRNLLSNAFKFTPAGGRISLSVLQSASSPYLTFSVSDTGLGIPQEEQNRIFDRFYQAKQPNNVTRGTGIGLSIAQQLTRMLDGDITVQSTVGQGSTFTCRMAIKPLPSDAPASRPLSLERQHAPTRRNQPLEPAPSAAQPQAVFHSKVIMVVEDHAELRTFIREILAPHYQVVEAVNGDDGFTLAQRIMPDLILSDVMMPIVDGFTLCERIKANPATASIPFVMLTAKTGTENELAALQKGADAFIEKPFNTDVLLQTIGNFLRQRQRSNAPAQEEPTEALPLDGDTQFLQNLYRVIAENLSDQDFNTESLAQQMGYSRSQLHRKIKALLKQSSTVVIRNMRLQEAKRLIETTSTPISDIAYQVGFSTPNYFSSKFKEYYGCSPIELRQ